MAITPRSRIGNTPLSNAVAQAQTPVSAIEPRSRINTTNNSITTPVASKQVYTPSPQTLEKNAELKKIVESNPDLQSKMPVVGENPNKIFSGGFISDTFDTLSALQYGVTGLLKGKSFKEGVETRQSFSDKDALGAMGVPGIVAGTIADIAVDPLTYVPIANVFSIARKIPVVKGVFGALDNAAVKAKDAVLKTQAGKAIAENLIYRFGQSEPYRKLAERNELNKAIQNENVVNAVRPITALDAGTQRKISEARKQGLLGNLQKAEEVGMGMEPPKIRTDFGMIDQQESFTNKLLLNKEKVEDALMGTLSEIDAAEAVKRFVKGDGTWSGFTSTFPKWIPENRRNKKILETVTSKINSLDDIQYPKNKAEQEVFDALFDEIDLRSGIDTKEIRQTMKSIQEGTYTPRPEIAIKPLSEAERYMNAEEMLGKDVLDKALPVFQHLDNLGEEAVNLGLLPREVWEKNVGTYMARLYRKYEGGTGEAANNFLRNRNKVTTASERFMKRDDMIPDDVREAMGEILEAGYPTAKSLVQLTRAVENAKFFKAIKDAGFAADEFIEGSMQMPNKRAFGELAGKWVPEYIFKDIAQLPEFQPPKGWLGSTLESAVSTFKFAKVILNPATHARNMISNFILNGFEGLPPGHPAYFEASAELMKGGGKYTKKAKEFGYGLNSFAANEITNWLDPKSGFLSKLNAKTKGSLEKIANIYQKEEDFAKLSQFIFQQKYMGKSAEEAWQIAERATFNYAQVTPFIRKMRSSIFGYPFITFTYKATPQVLKTAYKHTGRVSAIGKLRNAVENQVPSEELERERASEPEWIRNGFYMALPVKDKEGRRPYLDLTYMLPYGDLVSGSVFERGISRETGLPEGPENLALQKLPFVNTLVEISKNQDFYGNKVYKESDPIEKQVADISRHVIKFMSPPLIADQIAGGYRADGTQKQGSFMTVGLDGVKQGRVSMGGGIDEGGMQDRTLLQELFRNLGLKTTPVDIDLQENYADLTEQRAIRTILGEEGLVSEMTIPIEKKDTEGNTPTMKPKSRL
ncbi:MAG: hypothetical protein VW270_02095 [Candidatus Poseidoniales archaeon]